MRATIYLSALVVTASVTSFGALALPMNEDSTHKKTSAEPSNVWKPSNVWPSKPSIEQLLLPKSSKNEEPITGTKEAKEWLAGYGELLAYHKSHGTAVDWRKINTFQSLAAQQEEKRNASAFKMKTEKDRHEFRQNVEFVEKARSFSPLRKSHDHSPGSSSQTTKEEMASTGDTREKNPHDDYHEKIGLRYRGKKFAWDGPLSFSHGMHDPSRKMHKLPIQDPQNKEPHEEIEYYDAQEDFK